MTPSGVTPECAIDRPSGSPSPAPPGSPPDFLSARGGAAGAERLRTFRAILASLDFDATRVCEPGPGGQTVERRIEPPQSAATPESKAKEGFPIERAPSGCMLLNELFVPVYCEPAREKGREVWVVTFDEGNEPAGTYLDRHRDRVTASWCWAARGRSDTPGLLFGIRGADSLREYSCERSGWVRTLRADALDAVDRAR